MRSLHGDNDCGGADVQYWGCFGSRSLGPAKVEKPTLQGVTHGEAEGIHPRPVRARIGLPSGDRATRAAQDVIELPAQDSFLVGAFVELYRVGSVLDGRWDTFGGIGDVAFDAAGNLHIFDTQGLENLGRGPVGNAGPPVRAAGRRPGRVRARFRRVAAPGRAAGRASRGLHMEPGRLRGVPGQRRVRADDTHRGRGEDHIHGTAGTP